MESLRSHLRPKQSGAVCFWLGHRIRVQASSLREQEDQFQNLLGAWFSKLQSLYPKDGLFFTLKRDMMQILMNRIKKIPLILSIILLTACTPNTAPTSEAEAEKAPVEENAPAEENTPLNTEQAQNPESDAPPVEADSSELWLRILSPANEAVVNTSQIEVMGEAPAETILSINDELLLVPADGVFRQIILLEEGANLIELVASNYDGDEATLSLIIYYEP